MPSTAPPGAYSKPWPPWGKSGVVYVSTKLLGVVGVALAVVGVVDCPITSGDTAFRSARLTLADRFHIDQSKLGRRLNLTIPLLAAGALLTHLDFDVVWRYFSWANQTLAMIALWAAAVCGTYILMADEGFRLARSIAYPIGVLFALACAGVFLSRCLRPTARADSL